jgi:hypothetical protein
MDLLVCEMNRPAERREPGPLRRAYNLLRGAFKPLPPLRATNDEIRDQRIAAEEEVRTCLAGHGEVVKLDDRTPPFFVWVFQNVFHT